MDSQYSIPCDKYSSNRWCDWSFISLDLGKSKRKDKYTLALSVYFQHPNMELFLIMMLSLDIFRLKEYALESPKHFRS